jgi:predicted AAA+ superfamily ATPase
MGIYRHRSLEIQIKDSFDQSKVILLVGARQVGKSTLLKNLFPEIPLFVLDPVQDEYNLRNQADLFLKSFPPPLILNEVQYYPQLIASLKRSVDLVDEMGQYILTGSQNFSMLRNVSESMAGRVSIIQLNPMTFLERYQIACPYWIEAHLNNQNLVGHTETVPLEDSIFTIMWRGMMPGLIGKRDSFISTFFSSYVKTYVERDVRLLSDIKNLSDFSKFVRLIAMYSAQELNVSELGREIGIANSTAILWKNTMTQSFLWNELEPYYGSAIKRLSKKPKGFFFDTGMMCYLTMIDDPISLAKHPRVGAIFETFMANTLLYALKASGIHCSFYHWRTSHGQEVDLVIEYRGRLYPIEIKFKTNLSHSDIKGLVAFRQSYPNQDVAPGIILYAGETCRYLADDIIAVPWNSIASAPS